MPNYKIQSITDFTGGLNDILPPDQIKDNECVELVNMMPGLDSTPLKTRPGISRFFISSAIGANRVTGLYKFVKRQGSSRWIVSAGNKLIASGVVTATQKYRSKDSRFSYTGNWLDEKDTDRRLTRTTGDTVLATFVTIGANQTVRILTGKAPAAIVSPAVPKKGKKPAQPAVTEPCTADYRIDGGTWVIDLPTSPVAGEGATKVFVEHSFATAGTHTIELKLSDTTSGASMVIDSLEVEPPTGAYSTSSNNSTTLKTWDNADHDTTFCVYMDKVYVSNGVDPIQRWDGTTMPTIEDQFDLPDSPVAPYIINFRNRLWVAGVGSTVHFSGVASPNLTDPDEMWTGVPLSDGSTAPDSGGNQWVAADNGETVTGLGYLFNGVVVFKERSTYLWLYGDTDHPTNGKIELLVPGVGCASHYSIGYYNGAMYFLGQSAEGQYGVYRLQGAGIDDIAVKIPEALQRILATSSRKAKAVVYNHRYYIACDSGEDNESVRNLVFCYDLRRGGWSEIRGWSVGAFSVDRDMGHMFIGSDTANGLVYDFPSGTTDDGNAIPYSYRSKPFSGRSPFSRHRWRELRADVEGVNLTPISLGVSQNGVNDEAYRWSLEAPGWDYWDDGTGFWDDNTYWSSKEKTTRIRQSLVGSNETAEVFISGTCTSPVSVSRIGLVYRDKK